ncbi:MAG: hypothetical protein WC627_04750 [Legionella sp.]
MRFHQVEPLNHKYLWANPATGVVHLLVPMMAGKDIALDNTCQTFAEHNTFFSSAVASLNHYKTKVLADLEFITNEVIINQKRSTIRQIDTYMANFSSIIDASGLTKQSVSNRCNLQAAHLQVPHSGSAYFTPTFSIAHDNRFLNDMYDAFSNIRLAQTGSNKERFLARVAEEFAQRVLPINSAALIAEIVATMNTTHRTMFGDEFNVNFTISDDDIINLGYDNPNEDTIDSQAEIKSIMNNISSRIREELDFPAESVFKTTHINTLQFATQFLLAEINLFCSAHNITKKNFGTILHNNEEISTGLAAIIREAIQKDMDVESVICGYADLCLINYKDNDTDEDTNQALTDIQIRTIIQRFNAHYRTTKDTGHKNELLILETEAVGNTSFIAHMNSICLDATSLMPSTADDAETLVRARAEVANLPSVLPIQSEERDHIIEVDINDFKASIIDAIYNNNTVRLQMLLAVTDTNHRVFEELGRDFFSQFDSDPQTQELFNAVLTEISDTGLKSRFNRIVCNKIDVVFNKYNPLDNTLNNSYRVLQQAYAIKNNLTLEQVSDYHATSIIPALIGYLGIKNFKTVEQGYNKIVVQLRDSDVQKIDELIARFDSAILIKNTMVDSLYQEVGDKFGKTSTQYLELMKLNTNVAYPENAEHKMFRALELLSLNSGVETIVANANGWGEKGFIIKSSSTQLKAKVTEIYNKQRCQIKIDSNAVKRIYKKIKDDKDIRTLNSIANTDTPTKLEVALLMLNFGNDFTVTNVGANEYLINFTTVVYGPSKVAKVRELADLPNLNENGDIPFNFNNSSNRGSYDVPNKIAMHSKKALPDNPHTDKEKLEVILARLTNNIKGFANMRQSWFNKNIDPKVSKLETIATWLSDRDNVLTDAKRDVILGLIEDVCAIKRNRYGLFNPHSLTEFKTLAKNMGFDLTKRDRTHRNPKELEVLHTSVSAIDDFIDKHNNMNLAMTA